MAEEEPGLRAKLREGRWRLAGAADGELINGYLGYLADRGFSARTVRAYAFGLAVADVDIPRGWVRVMGNGGKERRVPLDPDVAGLIQAYLLAGRPETSSRALFVVAKGPHRGQPLTAAGLRTIFRYHRGRAGVPAGHPHALQHSFGTALAEAGMKAFHLLRLSAPHGAPAPHGARNRRCRHSRSTSTGGSPPHENRRDHLHSPRTLPP